MIETLIELFIIIIIIITKISKCFVATRNKEKNTEEREGLLRVNP